MRTASALIDSSRLSSSAKAWADQERVMFAEAPRQRLAQGRQLGAQAAPGELSERRRVAVAGRQLAQNLSARYTQNVTHHTGELEIGVLQHLVQAVGNSRMVMLELAAVTYQIAQFTDCARGDKTRTQEPIL